MIFASYNALSSHFMSGQITYKHINGNTYEFTLKLYQDCKGVEFLDPEVLKILPAVDGVDDSTIIVSLISQNDITTTCPGEVSTCQDPLSSYPFGVMEWVYKGTKTLPTLGGNQVYTIAHGRPARNAAITTADMSGNCINTGWYIKTTLNPNLSPRNSSPEFLNPPIGYICLNEPYNYNHNAFDSDGDSLVYKFTDCLSSDWNANPPIGPVCYVTPYSGANPISSSTGINLNSQTGEISFNPDVNNQVAIMALMVEEFRGGIKIGEVRRDLQISVQSCDNKLPEIQPWDVDSTDTNVYALTPYCLYFRATDMDIFDNTHNKDKIALTLTSAIPGTWSNPGPAHIINTGTFCWTPSCAEVRTQPYLITVIAQDFACPLPGITTKTFEVYVKPPDPVKPILLCINVVNDSTLELTWEMPVRILTNEKYLLYRSTNINGPYQLLTTINDISQLTYIDNSAGLDPVNNIYYYYIKTSSPTCGVTEELYSDTVSNIKLSSVFTDPYLKLSWNDSSGNCIFKIMRSVNGEYVFYDTTLSLTYTDTVTNCTPMFLQHRIDCMHPSGKCQMSSNIVIDTIPGGIPPPTVAKICKAEVNLNNSSTIFIDSDTSRIAFFVIYRYNTATAKYDSIGTVFNPGPLSFTDSLIDASLKSYSYKVIAVDTCGYYNDTGYYHQTINAVATGDYFSNKLNWNIYFTWDSDSTVYNVYRSDSLPLNFSFLKSTTNTFYTDSGLGCTKRFYYRIEAIYTGNALCDSVFSDTTSAIPMDSIKPFAPDPCNVTVQPSFTEIFMQFNNSSSSDVVRYELYSTQNPILLTTFSYNINGYAYTDSNAINLNSPSCYFLLAVDSCGNKSPASDTLCPINLSAAGGDRKNTLQWNDNLFFDPLYYVVYRGTSLPLDSVGTSDTLTYIDSALTSVCDVSYIYQIKAVYNESPPCNTSFSDTSFATTYDSLLPIYPEICNLSVQSNLKDILVKFNPSKSTDIDSYKLFYSDGTLIASFNTDSQYIDPGVLASDNQSQCYYMISKDTCGNSGNPSPDHCTIDLSANPALSANYLYWNSFTPWVPEGYNIYADTVLSKKYLGSTSDTFFTHHDLSCYDNIVYQIEAYKQDTTLNCYLSMSDTAWALCSAFELPNVFSPNGDDINETFIPKRIQNVISIDFTVYNRWGEKIYHSIDINKLWDGTNEHNKRKCAAGVYFYIATVEVLNNTEAFPLKLKGHITLLK